jgi:hypothetical protein
VPDVGHSNAGMAADAAMALFAAPAGDGITQRR